jgi:hypothetical protein
MSEYLSMLLYAAIVCGPALIIWDGVRKTRKLEAARNEAHQAFATAVIASNDHRLSFNGSTAKVVKVEEPANPYREPTSWFTLTIFARNEFGEYFMFKSTRPKPLIKHISHPMALKLLKDAYVPPAEA